MGYGQSDAFGYAMAREMRERRARESRDAAMQRVFPERCREHGGTLATIADDARCTDWTKNDADCRWNDDAPTGGKDGAQ